MTKKTATQAIRTTSQVIMAGIINFGQQSIRCLAEQVNRSKSAVHRHLQAQHRRNQHPESAFWETEAGAQWLARLVYATLYQFGLKNHIGAGQLSGFFELLRIDTHVGVSESTLRQCLQQMETLLPEFQAHCESSATCPSPARTVAMDETFFQQMMVLVLMDLPSGYLLLEEAAPDRSFTTWHERAGARLAALGLTVRHAVSDRAKALIKLATDGFQCAAGADLFHVQYDLGRWLSLRLARATRKAEVQRESVRQLLNDYEGQSSPDPKESGRLRGHLVYAEQDCERCQQAQASYRQHRQGLSDSVHPFHPTSGQTQDQAAVTQQLQAELDALARLAEERHLPDPKQVVNKLRRQLDDLGQHVGTWWIWVDALLLDKSEDAALNQWICHTLMPAVYWDYHYRKSKSPRDRKTFLSASEQAAQRLTTDSVTWQLSVGQYQQWQHWCEDKVKHFQRTSSAVEGRNGCLAQMYHNGRGLTEKRLRALTVVHNYGSRRQDGSTAAERLFEQDFPELFDWILAQMKPLPLPRRRKARPKPNLLNRLAVPL